MKLLFNHLPKNGGTSVHRALEAALGARYANMNEDATGQIRPDTALEAVTRYTRNDGLVAFGSHIESPRPEVRAEILATCLGIGLVRDPVDRIRSLYTYSRGKPHMPYHRFALENDLDDFYDALCDNRHYFSFPAQRAMLLYEYGAEKSGKLPELESLDYVEAFLERHYLLVGVTEDMAAFFARLEELLQRVTGDADFRIAGRHENRSPDNSDSQFTLSADRRERLGRRASSDFALHRWLGERGGYFNRRRVDECFPPPG